MKFCERIAQAPEMWVATKINGVLPRRMALTYVLDRKIADGTEERTESTAPTR